MGRVNCGFPPLDIAEKCGRKAQAAGDSLCPIRGGSMVKTGLWRLRRQGEQIEPQTTRNDSEVIDGFAKLLHLAREEAGLSVRELARRSGMDPTYLSRLERGLNPAPTWPKIAAIATQVPLSELARMMERLGAGKLKHSVLQLANDLERVIVSLPPSTFQDQDWASAMQVCLEKCMTVMQAWKNAGRPSSSPQAFVREPLHTETSGTRKSRKQPERQTP
jgi:transcriptional regulator with XRE-family HTH domain